MEGTVHELGEGRGKSHIDVCHEVEMLTCGVGVYAPGYTERRAQRIKEAYGIDVTAPAPAVHASTPSS